MGQHVTRCDKLHKIEVGIVLQFCQFCLPWAKALIAQLLALLAEAAEAADRCDGGALAEEKNPAEEAGPI